MTKSTDARTPGQRLAAAQRALDWSAGWAYNACDLRQTAAPGNHARRFQAAADGHRQTARRLLAGLGYDPLHGEVVTLAGLLTRIELERHRSFMASVFGPATGDGPPPLKKVACRPLVDVRPLVGAPLTGS